VNENNLKGMEQLVRFPVHPEQELQINYQQGNDVHSIVVRLVRENGRLFNDAPCVTNEMLKNYRETPAREKRIAHNQALAAEIKEPLRSQLIALLREHKTAEATQRYKDASGQDYSTAMFVIDELAHH
jgi:hypothetical protein